MSTIQTMVPISPPYSLSYFPQYDPVQSQPPSVIEPNVPCKISPDYLKLYAPIY